MAEDRADDLSRRPFGYDEDYRGPAFPKSQDQIDREESRSRYQEMLRGMDDIITTEYEADSHSK